MTDVSGPQGSSRPLYTPSPVKGDWKSSVTALLGGILRKIRRADSHDLPSLKTEQAKSKQPPPKPPRDLKLRAAMKAESKLFIQVLPQEGRYVSAPIPKPRSPKSTSSVPEQQVRSEVESSQRTKKQGPPVTPRSGKSAPKKPLQPQVQANDLVQARNKLKTTQTETSKPTPDNEPLYENASSSSAYENVSGGKQFRYHAQYENMTVQDESDYVSAEDIQKMRQEQLKNKERPTPRPRTKNKAKDDHYSTLNHDTAPKPKPRSYGSEPPAGYAKLGQFNTYDVPNSLKKNPDYDVPRSLQTPPGYDVPRSTSVRPSPEPVDTGNPDLEVWNNPAYGEIPPPLPPRNSVTSRSDSVDPSTGENLYESIEDEDFELQILESMMEVEDDGGSPNDASRLQPLFNDLVRLEAEMPTLIRTFKSQRPSRTNPLEWAAHMKQERLLVKQNLDNKGFDKLRNSIQSLMSEGLTSPAERDKVRSRVEKINAALAPALTAQYGVEGAKERLLKAPED